VVVAVIAGAVTLFPSLALLLRLTLAGRLSDVGTRDGRPPKHGPPLQARSSRSGRMAAASLVAGIGFLTVAEAGWAHALGAACFLFFVAFGYRAVLGESELT
jgi:cytochrome d ubiquinol oxidase subunit II